MFSTKRFFILLLLVMTITPIATKAIYIPSTQDTSTAPEKAIIVEFNPNSNLELLTSNENFNFYFANDHDVIYIYDKRSKYTWKTGLDTNESTYCSAGITLFENGEITQDTLEEKYCNYVEYDLNDTLIQLANSLVTFQYFAGKDMSLLVASSQTYNRSERKKATSTLKKVDDTHYYLDVYFTHDVDETKTTDDLDLQMYVHFYLTEKGVEFEVRHSELSGTMVPNLYSISFAQFLGATGGSTIKLQLKKNALNKWTAKQVGEPIYNEITPGYTLVPDGPGALIRNKKYNAALSSYSTYVYGTDYAQLDQYKNNATTYVPYKVASMPLFGISVGDDTQAAFVAYATKGHEYMQIVSTTQQNKADNNTNYNYTYAKFIYQAKYQQIYSQNAQGFQTLLEYPNVFDIHMNYDFLAGDGSNGEPEASYVGMAKAYREHLIETNQINVLTLDTKDIPIRIDFLMSDSENTIFGNRNIVATTADDVYDILKDLKDAGLTLINSGLMGWQKDGLTLGRPDKAQFDAKIGSKRDYKELINDAKELGYDVSFYQDYFTVNTEQISKYRNFIKHASDWYSYKLAFNFTGDPIVKEYYFARAIKSSEWTKKQIKTFDKLGIDSVTIAGITENLTSDYTDNTSREDARKIYQQLFSEVGSNYAINAVRPNAYLLKWVDRYLQADVYNTQYLVETDTVPFLMLVLQGSMEMYGPYCNFSFYDQASVLRMIDYNLYPTFMLTKEPSYVLADTTSAKYYSTEYDLYKDLILSIYNQINSALRPVLDASWIDREVVQNGFVVNTYNNGKKIYINYSEDTVIYNGVTVIPESFIVR